MSQKQWVDKGRKLDLNKTQCVLDKILGSREKLVSNPTTKRVPTICQVEALATIRWRGGKSRQSPRKTMPKKKGQLLVWNAGLETKHNKRWLWKWEISSSEHWRIKSRNVLLKLRWNERLKKDWRNWLLNVPSLFFACSCQNGNEKATLPK